MVGRLIPRGHPTLARTVLLIESHPCSAAGGVGWAVAHSAAVWAWVAVQVSAVAPKIPAARGRLSSRARS